MPPEALTSTLSKLVSQTLQNDDLQMTIRAVREIAQLSQALELFITSCKLPSSPAIEAFKQWNSNFNNKAAFDFKIFKGVKKNFRAL